MGAPVLSVRHAGYTNKFGQKTLRDVSFDVCAGEIVGVAGVEGNGATELAQIVTGLIAPEEGELYIKGKNVEGMPVRKVRNMNVAFISEDRMVYDLVSDASIEENLISDRYHKPGYHNWIGQLLKKKIAKESDQLITDYKVYCDSRKAAISTLSGGNMQKVITARECSSNPELLVVSQPTRGIDVGATELIRNRLVNMRSEGVAILLFSSDLAEVMEVSDRILVFHNGQIAAHLKNDASVNETILGEYMLGIKKQTADEVGGAVIA